MIVMTRCYQACAKEGELPDVDESHRSAGVDAEDADAWEGGDHTSKEGEEIGEGGHLGQKKDMREKNKARLCVDDKDIWMNWREKITVIETAASE